MADTLTHTPLRMTDRRRLSAGFCSSGRWVGSGPKSGDMQTRFPWRHLAASRGRNAECAFRVSRTAHSGFPPGSRGRWWGLAHGRGLGEGADTAFSSLSRAGQRAREPVRSTVPGVEVAEGHSFLRTALRAGAGIEEGGWQKKRKRRASLDTTEAASRLTRRACAAIVGARAPGMKHRP